jgi:hypothetical protein
MPDEIDNAEGRAARCALAYELAMRGLLGLARSGSVDAANVYARCRELAEPGGAPRHAAMNALVAEAQASGEYDAASQSMNSAISPTA